MSPGEVAARMRRSAEHGFDAALWHRPRSWRRRWTPPAAGNLTLAPESRGFVRADRAAHLAADDPGEVARVIEAAERALAGRVKFFGYPEVELARPVDYALDPHSGKRWPAKHAKGVDYRHDPPGDPKWIWELNRCQELPLLVAAWLFTGERRYADHVAAVIEQWVAQNPPGRGIAWSNGYEAGLRAISLSTAVDALRGAPSLPPQSAAKAVSVLWQHARWIERDPSTHSSANNHRIGELVGLITVSLLVPEVPGSAARARAAVAELADQVDRQILPDGTGAELAHHYHLHVVDLVLVAVACLDAVGDAVPRRLTAALERSASALAAQIGPGEPAPRYGDEDEAFALRLDAGGPCDVADLAAALAARLGHAGARRLAPRLTPKAWWLFGDEGRARFERTSPAPAPGSILLEHGGLAVLRRGRLRAVLDYGQLGFLSIAAHGHADALSVTVADGADDLVTDPGTGSYFRRADVRNAFRGTAFHATVLVDGQDQSEIGGAFLWTRHARAHRCFADLEHGVVVAEHDGYRVLPDPVRHRRALVVLDGRSLLVYDRLDALEAHAYSVGWPLHPRLEVVVRDGVAEAAIEGKTRLVVTPVASVPGTIRAVRGGERPLAGWWSPMLEAVEPAWFLHFDLQASGRLDVATLLSFDPGGSPPVLTPEGGDQLVVVQAGASSLRVRFALDAPHPVVVDRA
jgi:uncharacterized heparinase superfamily protein